ncbi:hypothetical protein [Paenibacillus silvisoli]|uniref:hypothetical protein n=1 Tax=Paenibacillus silvisoli TaxID=3110539 RepID=UPI002803CF9F|nr:hypothetical protein [Paenibacillus silvisoli]
MLQDLNVAYIGTVYPHHARVDLEEIKRMGCTSINLCMNEADWTYYRFSRHEIRKTAKELGLNVYLNFHGFGAFAATFPGHMYQMEHPDAVQVTNKGNKGEYVCCPNNQEFEGWLLGMTAEMIRDIEPEGVFWDEPRFAPVAGYPEEWTCYCGHCREAFERQLGYEMPDQLNEDVIAFRQSTLLGFVDRLMNAAKGIDPAIENILCLMSYDRDQDGNHSGGWYGVVDWEPFVALESVDVFAVDPYWIHERDQAYFERNTKEAIALSRRYGKACQIWVQSIWIVPGKERHIGETIRWAEALGADRIAVWAFRGESGSHYLNWGADPEACWQQVVDAYSELSARMGHDAEAEAVEEEEEEAYDNR